MTATVIVDLTVGAAARAGVDQGAGNDPGHLPPTPLSGGGDHIPNPNRDLHQAKARARAEAGTRARPGAGTGTGRGVRQGAGVNLKPEERMINLQGLDFAFITEH